MFLILESIWFAFNFLLEFASLKNTWENQKLQLTMSSKTKCGEADVASSQVSRDWNFLVPMHFPPLREAEQATLQEGPGESLMSCDGCTNILHLPHGWREPLVMGAWDLGPLCMKNPLCMLCLAFSMEDHLTGLEFWIEVCVREP